MRKNYFLSAALIALTGFGLVGCSDNPDRITNVNEVVKELVDLGGYVYDDKNGNGSVDTGEGLSGVIVQVMDPVSDKTITATTDSNGRYDFSVSLAEGSYNFKMTDSSSTPNGAIVNSVEYFMPEIQIDITQPGDGADGTPEQGAMAIDFPMISNPVMIGTNLGDITDTQAASVDISSLTELTFTFNKPVTVINDPVLVDTTKQPNEQISLTAEGTSAAAIKGATVLTSARTTVSYALPTLEKNHTFTLTWPATSLKASDNSEFGYLAAPQAETAVSPGPGTYAAAIAGALAAVDDQMTTLNAGFASINTGNALGIVTTAKTAKIESVVDAETTAKLNGWVNLNSKFAVFAPKSAMISNAQTGVTMTAGGRANAGAAGAVAAAAPLMTNTFKVQLSNVQEDLDYAPIVSYDGGSTWYYAVANWVNGRSKSAGNSLTITTGALDNLTAGLQRPYFLVKGFYNTSTTAGQDYTRLKVAMRQTNTAATAVTTGIGGLVQTSDYSGLTTNGIDTNTERSSDTWVNIFDGDLTDYKNRGFNRMNNAITLTANGSKVNSIPEPEIGASYQGSSYPYPLWVDASASAIETTIGSRANWFNMVEDHSILTDLVEHDGDLRNTPIPVADDSQSAAFGFQGGAVNTGDIVISGMEEAASATLNANDNPNPALGTKNTVIYVYFNEPMDKATIESTTNWATKSTGANTAPTVSKVEYTESVNTQSGLEVFRAKVTLSAAMPDQTQLEFAMGALVDKNGNFPVCGDGNKPTGKLTVFHTD